MENKLNVTTYEVINGLIRETLDHYYAHRDAESFFKLDGYLRACMESGLTREQIPALIEMKNVIVMG